MRGALRAGAGWRDETGTRSAEPWIGGYRIRYYLPSEKLTCGGEGRGYVASVLVLRVDKCPRAGFLVFDEVFAWPVLA